MTETWAPVPGLNGYERSSEGRVRWIDKDGKPSRESQTGSAIREGGKVIPLRRRNDHEDSDA